jgi:hypothetical protein
MREVLSEDQVEGESSSLKSDRELTREQAGEGVVSRVPHLSRLHL